MDFELMINSFPKLLNAAVVTLKLLSVSLIVGLFIGLLFAILRLNKENQELVKKKKQELIKKNKEVIEKFKSIAKLVDKKVFKFNKECKENGELYASIKPKEISNLIKEKTNADVSPSQIILKEELNKIGIFKLDINFHSEVKAIISLKITKIQTK